MRAVLFVIIIVVVAVVAALATGFLNIRQISGGEPAQVTASGNGVTATGKDPPAFEVQTGSVKVGTTDANVKVKVPKLQVMKPGNEADAATNNSM